MARLGQHFLYDRNMILKLLSFTNINKDDYVLEIGAGKGTLTEYLVKFARNVYAFEIDRKLIDYLEKKFKRYLNLTIIDKNFLNYDISQLCVEGAIKGEMKRFKIISNIPYYITTDILEYIVKNRNYFYEIYLMMQKEYAERLVAKKGTRNFSSITIFMEQFYKIDICYNISGKLFIPETEVDSSFVKFIPKSSVNRNYDEKIFNFIRSVFKYRRKNILNAIYLTGIVKERGKYKGGDEWGKNKLKEKLSEIEINTKLRPQDFDFTDYEKIYNTILN